MFTEYFILFMFKETYFTAQLTIAQTYSNFCSVINVLNNVHRRLELDKH